MADKKSKQPMQENDLKKKQNTLKKYQNKDDLISKTSSHNHFFTDDKVLIDKTLILALIVSTFLVLIKFYGCYLSGSLSLQASLLDSAADFFASLLNFFTIKIARKPANENFRFGHGKAEALAGFVQSLLILISAIWIVRHAFIDNQVHELNIDTPLIVFVILAISLLSTIILVYFQTITLKKTQSIAISADCMHYKVDLLTNAASIIALLCVKFFMIYWIDLMFGLLIAVYVGYGAWNILKQSIFILMDKDLGDELREKLTKIIKSDPQVIDIHDLRTRSAGMHLFFQVHIDVEAKLSLLEAHNIAERVEKKVLYHFKNSQILIHVDPYGYEHKH